MYIKISHFFHLKRRVQYSKFLHPSVLFFAIRCSKHYVKIIGLYSYFCHALSYPTRLYCLCDTILGRKNVVNETIEKRIFLDTILRIITHTSLWKDYSYYIAFLSESMSLKVSASLHICKLLIQSSLNHQPL